MTTSLDSPSAIVTDRRDTSDVATILLGRYLDWFQARLQIVESWKPGIDREFLGLIQPYKGSSGT